MTAGRFNKQVTLQRPITAEDGLGGYTRTWETVAVLWAEVVPLGGAQDAGNERLTIHPRYRVTLRERDDITPVMRLLYGDAVLTIDSIRPSGPRETLSVLETTQGEQT